MMLRLPRRIDESDPVKRLALLWDEALANPVHTAACGCMGGGGGIALHADMLEEDMLDFLAARHRTSPTVQELLQERRTARTADFARWVADALPRLPDAENQAVLAEITGVLESMTGQSPGGF